MRRLLVIFFAVLVLAGVLMGTVSAVVDSPADQITYTENVLLGDPSSAEGVTVSARYDYMDHLVWFSDHRPAEGESTDTDFRYYTSHTPFSDELVYYGVDMEVVSAWEMDWDYEIENTEDPGKFQGLMKAYYDLYMETEEGELTNTYIRYADSCDYYPLFGFVDAPGLTYSYWEAYEECYNAYSDSRLIGVTRAFNDYFRIPVLEDDWVQVVIDKRYSGSVSESIDVSESRKGADCYSMGSVGAVTGDTIYFTFNAVTDQGNTVDTSLIPGGYGLYAISIAGDVVDCDSLRTVCSLDPTHVPQEMWVDEAHDLLMLRTEKDSIWYLTVIDLETMEIAQQIELLELPEDSYCWTEVGDDFVLSVIDEVSISIYQQNEQGLYEFCYTAPLPSETLEDYAEDPEDSALESWRRRHNPIYNVNINVEYDFDGERLAVVSVMEMGYLPGEDEARYGTKAIWDDMCAYNLAIYTEDGLQYFGEYISSLEPIGVTEYAQRRCRLEDISVSFDS